MRVELLHALVAERYAATFTRRRRLMLITGIVLTGGIVVCVVVVVVNAIIATFRAAEFARRGRRGSPAPIRDARALVGFGTP